jgi:RNA polymerase sigma-70 factor (ECF subfamily)
LIEESVIEKSRAGDRRAFSEMVQTLSPVAWRIALRILASNEAAEDVAQESLVKVWRNLDRIRIGESFSSWFYRIVVNCCYDEIRRMKRLHPVKADEKTWLRLGELISGDSGGEPLVAEYEEILKTVTSELSPVQKTVFVLSDLEGMNNNQIAEITGGNLNSVKSNLHYARKRVKEIIKERY